MVAHNAASGAEIEHWPQNVKKQSTMLPVDAVKGRVESAAFGDNIIQLEDGSFYNLCLAARNVFEVDVDASIIDEVERIFYDGAPFAHVTSMSEPYETIQTLAGSFFAMRISWNSDIRWISVDDARSFAVFEDIFHRLKLPEKFAAVVPHKRKLQLYSAFFVVRSRCDTHNFHHDYRSSVGTSALTLITPLRNYAETESFQLLYDAKDTYGDDCSAQYTYQRGKAIVFGSGFLHSTEPGCSKDGEPHAYLCFTFGTDEADRWADISKTVEFQSRIIVNPNGKMQLTVLGDAIEEALRNYIEADTLAGSEGLDKTNGGAVPKSDVPRSHSPAMSAAPNSPIQRPLCESMEQGLRAQFQVLRGALHGSASVGLEDIVDACLCVFRSAPGRHGAAALPTCSDELREAASFFFQSVDSSNEQLGQHLFDVELWDDALVALARAVAEHDIALALETAETVAACAGYLLLPEIRRAEVVDDLHASVVRSDFLAARSAALGAATRGDRSRPQSVADAYAAARKRRHRKDYVAVAPRLTQDELIIVALYDCLLNELCPSILQPLGFPCSKLGLRSFVAATRATGTQRAVAAFGRVWHAAPEPGPLILRSFDKAPTRAHTLVVAFSSLGWNGVVRAEWGATLQAVGEGVHVAHALDTAQSWFMTDPMSGAYDDGAWWDRTLAELCAPYDRVCLLGESMGATAALRFARHATRSIVAFVPQVDVRDFAYSGRADFSDERKVRLRDAIVGACAETNAEVVLHVGKDPPDLRQLRYLPAEALRVIRHDVPGHALGSGLKERGILQRTVLRDLLGHQYVLPPAAV